VDRIFVFLVPELSYTKKDLNVPHSPQRTIIGELSRMITNALFLSHSLREHLTVQIFILKPKAHVIVIRSEEIRYLGPEFRSSASILLKVEEIIREKVSLELTNSNWFQPHRGLFARFQEKALDNLLTRAKNFHCFIFHSKSFPSSLHISVPLSFHDDFELLLKNSYDKVEFIIFLFPIGDFMDNIALSSVLPANEHLSFVSTDRELDNAKIISIVNVLLDQLEEKEEK